jgi:IS5 family transposase
VLTQQRRQKAPKVYSLHAPEVERIGGANVYRERQALTNGKAHKPYELKVYTQGQKRGVTDEIKRQFRRRAAIEPVIGHTKSEHRMERDYLAHRAGDAANAVLAAAGYNFRRLLRWLSFLLLVWLRGSVAQANVSLA